MLASTDPGLYARFTAVRPSCWGCGQYGMIARWIALSFVVISSDIGYRDIFVAQ